MSAGSLSVPKTHILNETLVAVGLGPHEVISLLRESPDDDAIAIVKAYDRLPVGSYTKLCNLDDLIRISSSSSVRVMEALYVELRKVRGIVAGIIVMQEAENIVRASIEVAKTGGTFSHDDRKLLLQIVGLAPVPRNQVQNITVMGGVDARTQLAINATVPRLEDIVKSLDGIVKELPKDTEDAAR